MLNNKLLVQSVVWSIAILAMNQVYADDSSNMEFINEKETSSLEKKLNPMSQKKPLNSNEIKLSINTSLHNPKDNRSQNDKTKLPKTHYGIGYEYRKSMREQRQKMERVVHSEKAQRPERIERPERINRPERIERPDRPGRH